MTIQLGKKYYRRPAYVQSVRTLRKTLRKITILKPYEKEPPAYDVISVRRLILYLLLSKLFISSLASKF